MVERRRRGTRASREWALAAEAALCLAVAGAALRVLGFARIARLAARLPARRSERPSDGAPAAVGRAVEAAARRAPWPVRCFEKGLAAHAMLRARGLPSVLYYGGRSDASRGLIAHVWVQIGAAPVMGAEAAGDFAVLAAFPSLPRVGT